MGGEIVAEETFQSGDTDFKGAADSDLVATQPRGDLYSGVLHRRSGLIARQARQLGIKAILLGGDGWDSPKLFEIGQTDAIDGSLLLEPLQHGKPRCLATQEFIRKYKAKFNETPDGLAAAGYDAAGVLIDAMERAPELTPKGCDS